MADDRSQRADCQLSMHWHDHNSAVLGTQLDVASPLAHLHEAALPERSDHLGAGDDRERRAHAESSMVAMIGGSMLSGSISSSKYSSNASRRLASASSTVPPWLATSTSRQRATCQDPSCVTAAVNRIGTSVRADAEAKFALRNVAPPAVRPW